VNALAFLLIVIVVSAVGSAVLWYQHRSPNTLESGIEAFQREMEALAPPDDENPDHRDGRT
jgi:cell division protein FtsL